MYRSLQATEKLHRAIQVGQVYEAKKLIQDGASLDHVLGMRGTALCAAIEARSYELTRCLIEAGCDVNARDFDGEPPLLLALRKALPLQGTHGTVGAPNHANIVPLLINHPQCMLNKIDPLTRMTALHFATGESMEQVVKWLMEARPEVELNVHLKDAEGNTPLHLAVFKDKAEIVQLIVNHPDCLGTVNTGDTSFRGYSFNIAGLTPLHMCARKGNCRFMELLLKRLTGGKKESLEKAIDTELREESELEMNLNALTLFERETCMHIACRYGHGALVRLLVDWGAQVDVKDNMNNSPLLLCLVSHDQWHTMNNDIPELLLKRGADPNIRASIHNTGYVKSDLEVTPMILAALNNNVELAKLLYKHGADVNGTDSMGKTPLYTALWENSLPVAMFLLRDCPDINVKLKLRDGSTCLHAMVKVLPKENIDIIHELVKYMFALGGTIEQNANGQTPIELALDYENSVLMDAFLEEMENGVNDMDKEAVMSTMTTAVEEGLTDIVQVLLSHGADIDEQGGAIESSYLYVALWNSQYKTAEFLVNNGLSLGAHISYLSLDGETVDDRDTSKSQTNDNVYQTGDSGDSEDDESVSSDSELVIKPAFRSWLRQVYTNPRSLQLSCLVSLRKYILENGILFKKIQELNLPSKLKDKLRYRDTRHNSV